MKIKTLKDLKPKREFPNSGDSGYFEGFFEGVDKTKEELKAEAIKWVKEGFLTNGDKDEIYFEALERNPKTNEELMKTVLCLTDIRMREKFGEFFNLKEKDLKTDVQILDEAVENLSSAIHNKVNYPEEKLK